MPTLQRLQTGLITKDDPFHVHKVLGLLCLLSFIVRFSLSGDSRDMGFGTHPEYTILSLGLHLLLNLSSFMFKIPKKRIRSGFRIWPEYRLHSFIFALRSVSTMAVTFLEERFGFAPNYGLNLLIVLSSMGLADSVSFLHGRNRSGFVRDLDVSPVVKYFFSCMQFAATAACLFGIRRYSTQFLFLGIIQGNAFLMTLRRKNLASHWFLVTTYGVALFLGFWVVLLEHCRFGQATVYTVGSVCNLGLLLRLTPMPRAIGLFQNKYVIWTLLWLLVQELRPILEQESMPQWQSRSFLACFVSLECTVIFWGWNKWRRHTKKESKSIWMNGLSSWPSFIDFSTLSWVRRTSTTSQYIESCSPQQKTG